jgi:hypothetical protein
MTLTTVTLPPPVHSHPAGRIRIPPSLPATTDAAPVYFRRPVMEIVACDLSEKKIASARFTESESCPVYRLEP